MIYFFILNKLKRQMPRPQQLLTKRINGTFKPHIITNMHSHASPRKFEFLPTCYQKISPLKFIRKVFLLDSIYVKFY